MVTPPLLDSTSVERDTGLDKGTLRLWERRYGFPRSKSMPGGERAYSASVLNRLQLVKHLADAGYRPKELVSMDEERLRAVLASARTREQAIEAARGQRSQLDPRWITMVMRHEVLSLRRELRIQIAQFGLAQTVDHLISPLAVRIGDAWLAGDLAVFEEHLFTEAVASVMREALAAFDQSGLGQRGPTVLLTSLPHELHGLGLLMAECHFAMEGCRRYAFGTGTPLLDVAEASSELGADIVALSISSHQTPRSVLASVRHLRELLPREVSIWLGGNSPLVLKHKWEAGIIAFAHANEVVPAVRHWRERHR